MKKLRNTLLLLCVHMYCTGQIAGYQYYSDLPKSSAAGFYNIALTPAVTAHMKADLSDVRVTDSAGKWIPHILRIPARQIIHDAIQYELKYSIAQNNPQSSVVLIDNGLNKISNIIFKIKNSAAQRFCALSGSNNKEDWFTINDSILPTPEEDDSLTTKRFRIRFPAVDYHYLRLIVKNNGKDPYNFTGVFSEGTADPIDFPAAKAQLNPKASIEQKDSLKLSYIKIVQTDSFLFDQLKISVSGSRYFSRAAELYLPATGAGNGTLGTLVQSFTISNNSTLEFHFPLVKAKEFYLLIYNADNMPLSINSVVTGYEEMFLTAYLEKQKPYQLFMGNASAAAPDYDLDQLNIKAGKDSFLFLIPGNTKAVSGGHEKAASKKANRVLLWSAISVTLLLLLFFTFKMLKDINKKNKTDDHL